MFSPPRLRFLKQEGAQEFPKLLSSLLILKEYGK